MAGKFLLDTNIVIAAFGDETTVQNSMDEADGVYLCAIVMGELLAGARKSGRSEANLQRVEDLAVKYSVLPCDAETARYYGLVKDGLRAKGQPIPENDVWIAAIALQNDLILITRDAHFEGVANLITESW